MPRSRFASVSWMALVGICVLCLAFPGYTRKLEFQKKGVSAGAIKPKPDYKNHNTPGPGMKKDCPGKPGKPDRPSQGPRTPYTGPSVSKPPPDNPRREKPRPPRPPDHGHGGGRPIPIPGLPPLPPPEPSEPWEFFPLLPWATTSGMPPEPCLRFLGPCIVTTRGTGMMKWGPWDFEVLPCDYGEKFVDPADKTCRTANDCSMLPVPWDCCGSLFMAGINKTKAKRYLRLNHKCRPVLRYCSCPAGSYRAEDFRTTDNPSGIQLGCIQGMCRTSLP